jgi:hypothetical protein
LFAEKLAFVFELQSKRWDSKASSLSNSLTNLTDSLTGQFTFGYDVLSRRTSLNRPNGVDTSYSYDSVGPVSKKSYLASSYPAKK